MSQGPLYGYSAELLAQLTGTHVTTTRRWKRALRAPRWLVRLIAVCIEGELGEIDPAWRGWRIQGGELWAPELGGYHFRPGEVRSIPFLHAQVIAYQQRQRFDLQADWIDQRYVSAEISSSPPSSSAA